MSVPATVSRRAINLGLGPALRNSSRFATRRPVGAYASYLLQMSQSSVSNPALAVFVSARYGSTSSEVRGGPSSGPPPGFDVEKAKKPLPQNHVKSEKKAGPSPDARKTATPPVDTPPAGATSKPSAEIETVDKEKAAVEASSEEEKKLTVWEKVKHEAKHYWDGSKLLATEVKISTRLAVKMGMGYELTRREYRQLNRTITDLVRLIPFLPFIIVPFGEALLPIVIKVFPGILPSTFEDQKSKDNKTARLRSARKEVSKFLQTTLKETGLPITKATYQKDQFATFFRKIRTTGDKPTAEDVIAACKIFKDDMTLDNLSRPQLVSMCRYLNLSSFGTDMMLRFLIRTRMRQLKQDDRVISYEGVDNLTVSELQLACASRGIRTHGVSPARLREDLQSWLDLRLKNGVPSTLLVLSNAFMYGQGQDSTNQIDALTNVLSSIPEELFHEMELELLTAEGAATNKQRLEVLKEQEELIEEENEQNEENANTGFATPRDHDNIDEKEERQAQAEAEEVKEAQVSEAVEAQKEGIAAAAAEKASTIKGSKEAAKKADAANPNKS